VTTKLRPPAREAAPASFDHLLSVVTEAQPHRRGVALGTELRGRIRRFVSDDLTRLNRVLPVPVAFADLRASIDAYGRALAEHTPDLMDEIRGLAVGAGVDLTVALLLQLRRELAGYHRVGASGDCSTVAHFGPVGPVIAQTVDLNGDLVTEAHLLSLHDVGRDRRWVGLLTFTGLLGYLGVNSHGLCIGLNLVLGGRWRPGIPGYAAIRHLLDTCCTAHECRQALEALPLASSRSFTFADRDGCAQVEVLDGCMQWWFEDSLPHTNHYLHELFAPHDALNIFARNGSIRRLQALRTGLQALPSDAQIAHYLDLLDRPPLLVAPSDDIRREATVARVAMSAGDRSLHVRLGAEPGARTWTLRQEAA
jgi:isopenicillin-N N-acyltransferase-like protein